MKKKTLGETIINGIDRFQDRMRGWYRDYKLGRHRKRSDRIIRSIQRYFVLSGGLAFLVGLAVNAPWWPGSVKLRYHAPIVYVDWSKFVSGLQQRIPDGSYQKVLEYQGIPASTATLSFVIYHLGWSDDVFDSMDYWKKLRSVEGIRMTPGRLEDEIISMRLQSVKIAYGYRDYDSTRKDVGQTYFPLQPDRFLDNLKKDPGMGLSGLMPSLPPGSRGAGKSFLADVFYQIFESVPDRMMKASMYEALKDASTFFTTYEIRNDGYSSTEELKVDASIPTQELVQQSLDANGILKGDRIGNQQRLLVTAIPPGERRVILFRSTDRPLQPGSVIIESRPLVSQVGDFAAWILVLPLIVFLL